MGSPSGTYRSPLRPFASRRGPGSPHTSGMQGGTPEQRQETRNPGPSRRRIRTQPPAARRVVFHEGMDRDHGGPCDPHAQRTSSTTDPRRRSKRPRTERAHMPTVLMPVERERQAALHAGLRRPADGASSSSAASLSGSVADLQSGGPHAPDTRPREPAADPRPAQGIGGRCSPPHSPQTAKARTAHRNNGGKTRAAQGRTQKRQRLPALRSPLTHCTLPRPARCPSEGSPPQSKRLGDTLASSHGTPPRLAPRRTRTG